MGLLASPSRLLLLEWFSLPVRTVPLVMLLCSVGVMMSGSVLFKFVWLICSTVYGLNAGEPPTFSMLMIMDLCVGLALLLILK